MRRIRTKRESMPGVPYTILFSLIWYSGLLRSVMNGQAIGELLLFFIAGLLPLTFTFQQIKRAMYFRKLHKQAMQRTPRKGKIVNCQKSYYQERGRRGRIYTKAEYILIIEIQNEGEYSPVQIQSEPYEWPIYRVLSSPNVDVYTDDTGWHHVIDGFEYKKRRSDPGIFSENPWNMDPTEDRGTLLRVIVYIVMILMLLLNLT